MSILIVPGLHGSGAGHWQSWLQDEERDVLRIAQEDWSTPDLVRWSLAIRKAIDEDAGPTWLIAHSFGCLAAVQATRGRDGTVAGAMLVAPADPDHFGQSLTQHLVSDALNYPSVVVASTNDPWIGFL